MKIIPELDKKFLPIDQYLTEYEQDALKGAHKTVVIALERSAGQVHACPITVFEEGIETERTLRVVERMIKAMLWVYGGWKITVCGSKSIYEHIKAVYAKDGARAFDNGFMGGVYPSKMKMGRTWEESQELGVKFFEFLGVKNLEEARKLDAAFVRDKGDEFTAKFGLFGGSLDGVFMKDNQMDSMMKGDYWHMPIMMSYTAGEFKSDLQAADMDEFKALAKDCLGENADKFLELCGDDLEKAIDTSRISGLEVGLRTFAKKNKENGIDAPLFFSVFNPSIPGWDNPGTFHSSDLWFWWENLAKCWRAFQGPHYDLARYMCNYLCNFVKCGDPNGLDNDGTPMTEWFAADAEKPGFMWLEDGKAAFRHNAPCPITELVMEAYKKRF